MMGGQSKTNQMRVELVCGGLPFGGTTTFCMFLGAGLQSLGAKCKVFSFKQEHPLGKDFDSLGIPVHRENDTALIFEDRLKGMYAAMKDFSPTAVFAVLGVEAFELLRYMPPGVFRVGMVHDHYEPIYDQLRLYRQFYQHVAVVAESIRLHLAEHFANTPCTYLQHGVFLNPPETVRAANENRPLRMIFFGRLDEGSKGVRLFPEVWRQLKQAGVPLQWTIHGTGPDEPFLRQQLAEAQAAGEVIFSQPVPHDQLGGIIRQHDVYFLCSRHEAGPLTLLEAMGFGLVPVCGDIPCLLQEVINEQNGFRVGRTDIPAYVRAISRLHTDRALLEKMSAAARQTVETGFSEVAMARRYVRFLEEKTPREPSPSWPNQISAKPMMHIRHPICSLPLRPMRRLLKRMQSGSAKSL